MSTLKYHQETLGRILAHLAQLGLGRTDFEPADAFVIMTDRRGNEDEVWTTFFEVLTWMDAEGIVRTANIQEFDNGFYASGVQLTSTGLAMLSEQPPTDTGLAQTVDEIVEDAKGADLGAATYTKIGAFVGGVLGGWTKAAGS